MISEYHRPRTLEEALILLAQPNTRPLGGGTVLNRPSPEQFAVVDLQALGLNKIHKNGNNLEIGATATLQVLLESPHIPPALAETLRLETTYNLRQMATVAGTLVSADGRSPFATGMLALDTKCTVFSNQYSVISLGDLLPYRTETLHGKLIIKIEIPLNVKLS
ncbi:MAG: FAD binding domain-containing protein, partial [Chloroflexi bacterium]|nr:FAD binding domain-containing protein [Chloroflexota bacterium]